MDELVSALAPRLRQFVAVAREEHVTRAAAAVGVPQPTLSRGIARLEADLGVTLFTRSGRTVRLTRAGRTLLAHAERALVALEAAARDLEGDADPVHGRVALAFLTTLGTVAVPRLLRGFRDEHPGIRFELVQGPPRVLLDRLRAGDADLCLLSPLPDDPDLLVEPLATEELRLAVPATHRLADRSGIALAEVADEPFVTYLPGYGLRDIVDAWCREAGFVPRPEFEGADVETLRGLVGAGLGVALLPATRGVLAPGLVELTVTAPRTTRTIGLVRVRGRTPSAPAQALSDHLRRVGLDPVAAPS